ncbi:hypothetical protein [Pedobacter heparinus]|uniref:hypothetical protein n=1 Tax=Pedobacter heparinus TaxID=984 RepID=UPI00292DB31B|nr:hypothetical protein [Pedobacter heparinus]
MTVTVLPILEPDTKPAAPLAKVMNERLIRFAKELQEIHLKALESAEPLFDDVVVYISYNSKYSIRWKIVNDVPGNIEAEVAGQCGRLGYIKWKTAAYGVIDKS